ncbi:ribosomal protein L1p/L10e family-domain-containing protein [Gongronella butleri]|nr:ribosomal protein L1p/L10e family-domain-containing protein [Gongronella butleri]
MVAAKKQQQQQQQLDYKQAEKALKALKAFADQQDSDALISGQRALWINIKLAKMTAVQPDRQIAIPVPHCALADDAEVCFIPIDQPKVYEEKVKAMKLARDVTVLSGKQFREKYGRFEAKRLACSQYGHFLLDAALASKLHNMFGKPFQKANRDPVIIKVVGPHNKPIDVDELEKNINQGINTVVYHQTPSDQKVCKFGHVDMEPKALLANFKAVMAQLEQDFEWKYVQNVSVRLEDGETLPIYCCVPGTWLLDEADKANKTEATLKKAAKAVQEKKAPATKKAPAKKAAAVAAAEPKEAPAKKPTRAAAAAKTTNSKAAPKKANDKTPTKNVRTPKQITKKKTAKK